MLQYFTYGACARASKMGLAAVWLFGSSVTAEPVEILALGDSLTAGYGLPEPEGFVQQMQTWLTQRGHEVTLVNAGVSGDTTAGGLSRVEWSLTPHTDALLVALGGNDLLRGLPPEVVRTNINAILEIADQSNLQIMIVGMTAPGNYGADYKRDFDSIYPQAAQAYDAIYHESFFQGLLGDSTDPASIREYLQPDGIHPNAEGVTKIVDEMGPSIEKLILKIQGGR